MHKHTGRRTGTFSAALFWSVIAAAFIGPGTVTSAGKAGAQHGTALLWAVGLSILATLVLQEAAARLTIASGRNLGEHLRLRFLRQPIIPFLVWFGVAFGCAAYEAGNILGAVAGLQLVVPGNGQFYTTIIFLFALVLLYAQKPQKVARTLGMLVAIMGIAFIIVAVNTPVTLHQLIAGFKPSVSQSSTLLIIALVGTTIVPYNLFLGSRLGSGQSLTGMRRGLTIAVVFGGLITMSILIAGIRLSGTFTFEALGATLSNQLAPWAGYLFGVGLFAAGLTSAVTAPLAAAITAQSIFPEWKEGSLPYRLVWIIVLCTGFVLGITHVQPIPVILAAQAFNGMLLPVVVFMLFIVAFGQGPSKTRAWYTVVAWIILVTVSFLGMHSLITVGGRLSLWNADNHQSLLVAACISLLIGFLALRGVGTGTGSITHHS